MKRFLLLALSVITLTIAKASDTNVTLKSGSLDFLSRSGEYAYLEINWSGAQVVEFGRNMKVEKTFGSVAEYNKKQGSDWVRDWPTVQRRATEGVALRKNGSVCFNKKNKNGLQICCSPATWKFYKSTKDTDEKASYDKHYVMVDPAKAKYKFVVTVSKIDMGSGAASAFGGMSTGGAIMTGTMKAVEIKTGKTLATFDIKECQGMGNFAQYIRLQMLFSTLMANGVLPLK
jgi:hypothetical protein